MATENHPPFYILSLFLNKCPLYYKHQNKLHTKENRKETASSQYLRYNSAHPAYTFKGIVKSQMFRLRRLCSRNEDYVTAIMGLRERCANSGYDKKMVDEVLKDAESLQRTLTRRKQVEDIEPDCKIRWVTMAKSNAEKEIEHFVKSMNSALKTRRIQFELIKTTAPTLGKLLFNDPTTFSNICKSTCYICKSKAKGEEKKAASKTNKEEYRIDQRTTCNDSGIYLVTCKCKEQYVGKTTVSFGRRFKEHWTKNTSVKDHLVNCDTQPTHQDVKIQFLENVWDRGKYSLSEREYLWNRRLKGDINVQKTLKNI